jgi:hypothetical protein
MIAANGIGMNIIIRKCGRTDAQNQLPSHRTRSCQKKEILWLASQFVATTASIRFVPVTHYRSQTAIAQLLFTVIGNGGLHSRMRRSLIVKHIIRAGATGKYL